MQHLHFVHMCSRIRVAPAENTCWQYLHCTLGVVLCSSSTCSTCFHTPSSRFAGCGLVRGSHAFVAVAGRGFNEPLLESGGREEHDLRFICLCVLFVSC